MRIKDICSGVTDGSHNPPQGLENSDYLMLSSKNVFDDKITFDSPRYLSQIDFEQESKRTRIKSGDVLLTIVGTVGRAAVVGENMPQFTLQRSVAVLHPNVEICDSRYLMYALQANRNHIESRAKGVAQKGIYLKEVADIELQIPLLSEQTHRVKVLDKIAFVIKFHQKQLQKLDELVKARFVEMFGDDKYSKMPLINLITEGAGLSYGIVQPGDSGTGDMGVLRPVDMVNGEISTHSIKYIDRSIGASFKKTELVGDELLITVRGTTGVTALTDSRFKNMNVTRGIAVIRYDRRKINPIYLNAFLNTDESQQYIQEHTRGATLQQINLSDLRVHMIPVPPIELQEKLADFIEQVDKSKLHVPSGNALCIRYPIFIEMMFLRGV